MNSDLHALLRSITIFIVLLGNGAGAIALARPSDVSSPSAKPLSYDLYEIRLNASQHSVHVGQPILLEVDVVNRSANAVFISDVTPWEATHLLVFRDGKLVAPSSPYAAPYRTRFPRQVRVEPGQSFAYRWWGSSPDGGEPGTYYPLSYWGYWQELPAGHYTIVAAPEVLTARFRGKWIYADKRDLSNTIEVDVN